MQDDMVSTTLVGSDGAPRATVSASAIDSIESGKKSKEQTQKGIDSDNPSEPPKQAPLADVGHLWASVRDEIFDLQAFRICIPAILYVVQNNLMMFGAGYMCEHLRNIVRRFLTLCY